MENRRYDNTVPGKYKYFLALYVIIILTPACLYALSDSLWIEDRSALPGGIYSVSVYCQISQDVCAVEIPLITNGEYLVFDTATSEGSILPGDMKLIARVTENGKRLGITIIPLGGLDQIFPPGGKLAEVYFHIKPNAGYDIISIDTLSDTIYLMNDSSIFVIQMPVFWIEGGITFVPYSFRRSSIYLDYVGPIHPCGDANYDRNVNLADVVWIVNFIFLGGDPAKLYYLADVNVDDRVNLTDIIYLANYLYRGGPEPCAD
jgi:hypothetical protein